MKSLMSFSDSSLTRSEMKSVKGGVWDCMCRDSSGNLNPKAGGWTATYSGNTQKGQIEAGVAAGNYCRYTGSCHWS